MPKNISKLILAVLLISSLLAACTTADPVKDIPPKALLETFYNLCESTTECVKIDYGATTTGLPFVKSNKLYGRWCIEVFVQKNTGQKIHAVVEVTQVGVDPDSNTSWGSYPAIQNQDCGYFKK
jgi:predicted small secreted protein